MTEKLKLSLFAMKRQAFQAFQIQKPSFWLKYLILYRKTKLLIFKNVNFPWVSLFANTLESFSD